MFGSWVTDLIIHKLVLFLILGVLFSFIWRVAKVLFKGSLIYIVITTLAFGVVYVVVFITNFFS